MIHEAEELLDAFRTLPNRVERPRTFMEIAGYPHYENVCSNILAFFMDPEESHGLGTLVLDALTGAGNIATGGEGVGGKVSVKREVVTEASNRIDILIESDNRTILIENKIYASVSNPFGDYADYLDRRTQEERAGHKILLTLYPTNEGSNWGFENLTYTDFVGEIRSLLGRYASNADARHLTLFLDFLNTLENLHRGTRLNKDFIQLLVEREDQVEHFFTGIEKLKREMREKIKELRNRITVDKYQNVARLRLWQDPMGRYDDLPHDIYISDSLTVQVETSLFPKGWEIWIWPKVGDYSDLTDHLQKLKVSFEEYEEDGGGVLHSDSYKYKYDENLDGISSLLQDLIDKLATRQEGGE